MKINKNKNSLRFRILIIFFIIWAVLFIIISVYANFTQKILIREIKTTNQNMLNLYGAQLDTLCTEINRCLANTVTTADFDEGSFSESAFARELAKDVLLYDNQFSFYYCNPDKSRYIFQTASNITLKEREEFSRYFYELNGPAAPEWQLVLVEENYYLTKYFAQNGNYIGAWISLPNALKLYADNQFASQAALLFTNPDGQPLAGLNKTGISMEKYTDNKYMDKHYMELTVPILSKRLNLNLMIPYDAILASLNFVRIVEALILICIILCIPMLLYYLSRLVFRPMETLTSAMNAVEAGNYTISVPAADTSDEFQRVGTAFNNMVTEINRLKVDIYEREIYNQRLELEKLQQQVKPHFYLNCLNIIYNLAQGGEYALIQELCMAQVKYFRYMLKSSFSTVSIKEEFKHIENYLHIQQLRYPDRFFIDLTLHSELENVEIPPLLLHVFTENVVKHAASLGKIHFGISVSVYDEHYIQILITDDGPGFLPELLDRLNRGESISENGRHIGISNTIKRLELFYQGDCKVTFGSQTPHGARIHILIPAKGENRLESTDH